MTFRSIVLTIAVILLIIGLSIVGLGLMFGGKSSKDQWPPVKSDCPDFWTAQSSGGSTNCHPPTGQGRGTGKCGSINTSHPSFNGPTGQCNKYKWSQRCGVSWNGVTNDSSPCQDTST